MHDETKIYQLRADVRVLASTPEEALRRFIEKLRDLQDHLDGILFDVDGATVEVPAEWACDNGIGTLTVEIEEGRVPFRVEAAPRAKIREGRPIPKEFWEAYGRDGTFRVDLPYHGYYVGPGADSERPEGYVVTDGRCLLCGGTFPFVEMHGDSIKGFVCAGCRERSNDRR